MYFYKYSTFLSNTENKNNPKLYCYKRFLHIIQKNNNKLNKCFLQKLNVRDQNLSVEQWNISTENSGVP